MSCCATSGSGFCSADNPTAERPGTRRVRIITILRRTIERRRQRLALLELGDRMLQDIGVSRDQAPKEGRRPFWR
jgi:uncharacterized protein YjiS (DUF1127 family)